MSRTTLAVVALLFAVLAALWLARARETLRGGPAPAEVALLPELVPERVRLVRIDHLQRGFQLRFERDAAGRWYLTDPLAYPADGALVRTLLAQLATARAEPAPEVERGEVGLDPPAVVVELVQVGGPQGAERELRVELGGLDLDPARVHARVPGHPAGAGSDALFRTTRALVNTLERNPDDYREPRITAIPAHQVVGLRRRGRVYLDAESGLVDLAFDAVAGPDGWKRVGAPTVSLDPIAMGLLARGAAELEVARFTDDSPTDLAQYGLDAPRFTLEIEPLEGDPVTLAFGSPPALGEQAVGELPWFCRRGGAEHVFEVEARAVELLTRPAELFFDQLLVRARREDVARLELEGGGTRRVLARERDGWSVGTLAPDGGEGPRHPGNPDAIEEALARLERAQLVEHFPGETFAPTDPPSSFALVLANGARMGGALGAPLRDPGSGATGRQFLRDGDEVVALVDDEVLALCTRPLDDFRSRTVHRIQEGLVRAVELHEVAAGRTFVYVNPGTNQWSPEGETIRAPDAFVRSLDALLNLGARRWLPDEPGDEPRLAVRILPQHGEPLAFTFGRSAAGLAVCTTAAGQRAEVDPALIETLLALF